MWGLLVKIVLWLLGLFLKPKESAEAVQAHDAGVAQTTAAVEQQAAHAAQAEAQAVVDAPTTQAGVVDELQKGAF